MATRQRVVLGQIGAPHGVKGWLKVQPFTEAQETLLGYDEWQLGAGESWSMHRLVEGRAQGHHLVVHLEGLGDRDQARALTGAQVALWRDELPPPARGEYYWCDLEGLEVVTGTGASLGRVERLMETGANDVLVVRGERERLLPVVWGTVILEVDLEQGRIRVDWEPDF